VLTKFKKEGLLEMSFPFAQEQIIFGDFDFFQALFLTLLCFE